jgi:putative ABC transport system permease protein
MLLFITSNTMMQSVRERTGEFAVLKTLGFTDGAVLALVISEALALSLVAAGLGIWLSVLVAPLIRGTLNLPPLHLSVVLAAAAAAGLVALVSGGPPAWRARRLSVVDALAGRR